MTESKKRLKRLEKKMDRFGTDRTNLQTKLRDHKIGELIKQNLSRIPSGPDEIEVADYENGVDKTVKITLDPRLSPVENMEKYFKTYKKSRRGMEMLDEQVKKTEKEINDLREKIREIEKLLPEDLLLLEKANVTVNSSKLKSGPTRSVPRQFVSINGLTILVGKNDAQNDEITFKRARGNDYWLHVRNNKGSHVVILARKKGLEIPYDTILDAAQLAVHFSSVRSSGKGDVIYTQRKNVHKPKGSKPGLVVCYRDKNIFVHIEKERLDRLFNQ